MIDLFGNIDTQAANSRCLGCGKAHADARTVTLVDGSTACNYSEAWRLECQARDMLARPLDTRRWQISEIESRDGAAVVEALRERLTAIWCAQQNEKMRA